MSASSRRHVLALCLAPLAAALCLAGCKKPEASAATRTDAAPIRVATITVEERAMPRFLAVTGSLKADLETDVAADSIGKVVRTFVERGQPVKAGDPLVALDTRASSLTAQQAKENLKLATENSELAQLECARGKQLLASGTIPQADYDRRFTNCAVTSAQVEAATASDQLAKKNVADAIVRAPFAGVVGERFVNLGQVTQASTRVASIYKVDPLRLQLTVPEADLGQVRAGQEVEFRVAAWEQIFKGTVKYLSPNVRAVSRDLVIEAVVPNPKVDGSVLLRPGMFVSARLWIGEAQVAVVPRAALRKGEVATSVFQVTGGKLFERIVRLGEERDGQVALLAGAKKGDRLVAAPDEKTRDGVLVVE